MSTRDDIAAVLADVPGVDAKPDRPGVLHTGQAWPAWLESTPLTDCARSHTWQVFVVLPAGSTGATDTARDELLDPVWDALTELGSVDRAQPMSTTVQDSGAAVPLLCFTLTTSR